MKVGKERNGGVDYERLIDGFDKMVCCLNSLGFKFSSMIFDSAVFMLMFFNNFSEHIFLHYTK